MHFFNKRGIHRYSTVQQQEACPNNVTCARVTRYRVVDFLAIQAAIRPTMASAEGKECTLYIQPVYSLVARRKPQRSNSLQSTNELLMESRLVQPLEQCLVCF